MFERVAAVLPAFLRVVHRKLGRALKRATARREKTGQRGPAVVEREADAQQDEAIAQGKEWCLGKCGTEAKTPHSHLQLGMRLLESNAVGAHPEVSGQKLEAGAETVGSMIVWVWHTFPK